MAYLGLEKRLQSEIMSRTKINTYVKSKIRERAMDAGAYDGRFRSKVIKDKKKHASKRHCKKPIRDSE